MHQAAWIRLAAVFAFSSMLVFLARPQRRPTAADPLRELQAAAERTGHAAWGHWGDQPERYAAWSNHSNRLIPVYTFGMSLESVAGARSIYRDPSQLAQLYGRLPETTLNPDADYFDQTDIHRLQLAAAAAGKKRIILVVFDGLDWTTTRTAAIAAGGRVAYDAGRGTGLSFQDYRGAPTDYGLCVTSPANDGTTFDVDAQAVRNPGGRTAGGYDPRLGGRTAWNVRADLRYLIGRNRARPHAVTDSAASATSLCTGRKTYNDAINVDPQGSPIEPIAVTLQKQGWAVGAVTSVPISHATPACAYANNVSRDDYQDIARDQLGEPSITHRTAPLPGLDVLNGGGFGVDVEDHRLAARRRIPAGLDHRRHGVANMVRVHELLFRVRASVGAQGRRELDNGLALEAVQAQGHGDALPLAAAQRPGLSPQLPMVDVAVDPDGPGVVTRLHGVLIAQRKCSGPSGCAATGWRFRDLARFAKTGRPVRRTP